MSRCKVTFFLILLITLLQSCTICCITTYEAVNDANKKELTVRDDSVIEIYIRDGIYYAGTPVQYTNVPTPIFRISAGQWPLARRWINFPSNRRDQSSESVYVYFPLDKKLVAEWNKEHGTNYKFKRFTPDIYTEQTFDMKGARLVGKYEPRSSLILADFIARGNDALIKNKNNCVISILSAPLYIVDVALTIPANILVWMCSDLPYNVYYMMK